ncbi:MAG: histidine phosphatase family protein [Colwellia sp.]|nr:histidine phosphatase family protein [Colwellia sp.]
MKTRIYLARHGETLWNKTQRLQGQLDSELTPLGKTQSLQIADKLVTKNIDLIISSPLGRALESAFICQQKLHVTHQISENLMERNLGDWQGEEVNKLQVLPAYDEMLNQITSLTINNAESALACGQRIFKTLKQLANEHLGQNLLIIFHGEALRCLLFLLGKKETTNAFDLYKNGCIVTLDFQPQVPYFTIIST